MTRTIAEVLRDATATLAASGIEAPAREARRLLLHALGLPAGAVIDPTAAIDPGRLAPLLARRAAREPMAFIRGRQGFWTLDLEVSPATLIPRADSETLIAAAVAARPRRERVRRVLDLGTGTGALLLAALTEFPQAWGLGIDLSATAAALAARNAAAAGLDGRAEFVCGGWAAAIAGQFDLVLCNPPYIKAAAIGDLMPEVAAHEPRTALDGGPDGLDAYRNVLPELPRLLAPGGIAVLELGAGQGGDVTRLAVAAGLSRLSLMPDLGGVDRALVLRVTGD